MKEKSEGLFLHKAINTVFSAYGQLSVSTTTPFFFFGRTWKAEICADKHNNNICPLQLSFKDGKKCNTEQLWVLQVMLTSESSERVNLAAAIGVWASEGQRHARNGNLESSGALSSLRHELGQDKTFPCTLNYSVYLLQCISNHNSSTPAQEFSVQADTRLAMLLSFNTKWQDDLKWRLDYIWDADMQKENIPFMHESVSVLYIY